MTPLAVAMLIALIDNAPAFAKSYEVSKLAEDVSPEDMARLQAAKDAAVARADAAAKEVYGA